MNKKILLHNVVRGTFEQGCYYCTQCGEAHGDGDGFVGQKCSGKVQPKSDWEEEFARDFFNDDSWNVNHYHVVKDFIRNQIRAERLEVLKDILEKIQFIHDRFDFYEDGPLTLEREIREAITETIEGMEKYDR